MTSVAHLSKGAPAHYETYYPKRAEVSKLAGHSPHALLRDEEGRLYGLMSDDNPATNALLRAGTVDNRSTLHLWVHLPSSSSSSPPVEFPRVNQPYAVRNYATRASSGVLTPLLYPEWMPRMRGKSGSVVCAMTDVSVEALRQLMLTPASVVRKAERAAAGKAEEEAEAETEAERRALAMRLLSFARFAEREAARERAAQKLRGLPSTTPRPKSAKGTKRRPIIRPSPSPPP